MILIIWIPERYSVLIHLRGRAGRADDDRRHTLAWHAAASQIGIDPLADQRQYTAEGQHLVVLRSGRRACADGSGMLVLQKLFEGRI